MPPVGAVLPEVMGFQAVANLTPRPCRSTVLILLHSSPGDMGNLAAGRLRADLELKCTGGGVGNTGSQQFCSFDSFELLVGKNSHCLCNCFFWFGSILFLFSCICPQESCRCSEGIFQAEWHQSAEMHSVSEFLKRSLVQSQFLMVAH